MKSLEALPILGPLVIPGAVALTVAALAALWFHRARPLAPRTRLALLAAAAAAPVVAALVVDAWWRPFAAPVGWATWWWLAPITLAGLLLLARPRGGGTTRLHGARAADDADPAPRPTPTAPHAPRRPLRRAGATAADLVGVVAVVGAAALAINAWFAAYPTLGDYLGTTAPEVSLDHLAQSHDAAGTGTPVGTAAGRGTGAPGGAPTASEGPAAPADTLGARLAAADPGAASRTTGTIASVDIPAAASGFAARTALVYLPPAAVSAHPPQLPVLVLMAGQPGEPNDWVRKGNLQATMDAFAAAHGGRAPIVVVPDPLGGSTLNPLCSDTSHGKVATYLEQDVARWIDANFGPAPRPEFRAIGGISNGGTCALQVGTRRPADWPVVIDLAGELHPDLGGVERTIADGFDGDQAVFEANDPLTQLQSAADTADRRFAGSHAYFGVGSEDVDTGEAAVRLHEAARAAGLDTTLEHVPGTHQWQVWAALLPGALTWYANLTGLTS